MLSDDELKAAIFNTDPSSWTTAANPEITPKPLTLDELSAIMRKIRREFGPPPSKPDPHRCIQCKEEMSEPAMGIGVGIWSPAAYLCGRCAVMVKQEFFYKLRQGRIASVDRRSS